MLVGIVLFFGPHTYSAFRSRHPGHDVRARREGPYMLVYSLVSLAGLVVLVRGYQQWEGAEVLYQGAEWTHAVAAVAMLPALVLFAAGNLPAGHVKQRVGHPMVLGTLLWAAVHLLTGLSARAALLFAPFAVWAALDFVLATRRVPKPSVPAVKWDVVAVVAGTGVYAALVLGLHVRWFGVSPLG